MLEVDLPSEWVKTKMNSQTCENIVIEKKDSKIDSEQPPRNISIKISKAHPEWKHFKTYCHENGIYKIYQLKRAKNFVKKMFDNDFWRPKMKDHLKNRQKA